MTQRYRGRYLVTTALRRLGLNLPNMAYEPGERLELYAQAQELRDTQFA
jgi:hypothetical protein